jgi:hypothetical protein
LQIKYLNWTEVLAVFLVLTMCTGTCVAGPLLAKNDPPRVLPSNIVAAWKKTGARVGWMGPNMIGSTWIG